MNRLREGKEDWLYFTEAWSPRTEATYSDASILIGSAEPGLCALSDGHQATERWRRV